MVQEVQTAVTIPQETTLDTIQAIGTSSVKIREWRQTTWHYTSGVTASWSISWSWDPWNPRDSWKLSPNLTIGSSYWKMEYAKKMGSIRVPVAWSYQITLSWSWWSSISNATIVLMWGWNQLYTKTFTSSSSETIVKNVDLWKFDTVEVYWSLYCSSGYSSSMTMQVSQLEIQQL